MNTDDEYERTFPDALVELRERVNKHLEEAKSDYEKLDTIEKLYTELDNIGSVSIRDTPGESGRVVIEAYVGSLRPVMDTGELRADPVVILMKEFDGKAEWDEDSQFYKITAEVWNKKWSYS